MPPQQMQLWAKCTTFHPKPVNAHPFREGGGGGVRNCPFDQGVAGWCTSRVLRKESGGGGGGVRSLLKCAWAPATLHHSGESQTSVTLKVRAGTPLIPAVPLHCSACLCAPVPLLLPCPFPDQMCPGFRILPLYAPNSGSTTETDNWGTDGSRYTCTNKAQSALNPCR